MNEPNVNLAILDGYDPETVAMLQAFYSRSHLPIGDRLRELGTDVSSVKESLKKYYVGYGHKSIGQCGSVCLFIEGVSILVAKVFQDSSLYNGQETSTRFIDFASRPIHNPIPEFEKVNDSWLNFYSEAFTPTLEHVISTHSLDVQNQKDFDAAKARTFDILRAFIPAGCSTQLSWYSSFTHMADRLAQLRQHPLKEVREVSDAIVEYMQKKYPYAFSDLGAKTLDDSEYYCSESLDLNYLPLSVDDYDSWPTFDARWVSSGWQMRTTCGIKRNKGVPAPRHLSYLGRIVVSHTMDYGSFRDLQRHRNCIQMMPILKTRMGFEEWYLDALPLNVRNEAEVLIDKQVCAITSALNMYDSADVQYYIPLGFKVPCLLDMDYPQAVYISEMRTNKTVHPTVRKFACQLAQFTESLGLGDVHADYSVDDFTIRRGQQDIKFR